MRGGYTAITLAALALTCGGELRRLAAELTGLARESLPAPVFDISTINLMIISFFCICFIEKPYIKPKAAAAAALSLAYALSSGGSGLFSGLSPALLAVMATLVLCSGIIKLKKNRARNKAEKIRLDFAPFKNILIFASIAVLLCLILSVFMRGDTALLLRYISGAAISSATSFGGGEAYVSVADGIFVQTGMIGAQVYYNQIVAAANALPGPILVKIASSVGFTIGSGHGGIALGWLMAAAGFAIAAGISASGALLVYAFFDRLKNSPVLMRIKTYILPVICGMLIATALSILCECIGTASRVGGLHPLAGLVLAALLVAGSLLLHKRLHVNDIILLALNGGITLVLLGITGS